MITVFVDTIYFVAVINPRDQWHQKALAIRPWLVDKRLLTTETILLETLNFFCEYGTNMRRVTSLFIRDVLTDPNFEVIGITTEQFLDGLDLYDSRDDKGYSLTDCISMNVCREHDITKVLTHDRHFEQEGFEILL
jgi:predicted nucleic acid-binding protein